MLDVTALVGFGVTDGTTGGGGGTPPALVLIDRTAGSNIGNMTDKGGLAAAFDGDADEEGAVSATRLSTTAYVGKTLASARVIGRAIIYGSSDYGFVVSTSATITITLYGKAGTAPSSGTDGTSLGSTSFTDVNSGTGITIDSTDLATSWDHVWAYITHDIGIDRNIFCAELKLYAWE